MSMKHLLVLPILFGLIAVGAVSAKEASQSMDRLTPGKVIERKIDGGQTHSFQVVLQQGEFLRATIISRDVDIGAALYGRDGRILLSVDLLKYPSQEPVSFETPVAGEYRLEIMANAAAVVHGHYELKSEVKAQSDPLDRMRLTAERILIAANDLEFQGVAEAVQKSVDTRTETLELWRKLDDKYWEAYSLHCNGRASEGINKRQEALNYYGQALSLRRQIGDRFGEAGTLNNSGNVYKDLGDKEKALVYYNEALQVSRSINDPLGQAGTLMNLGDLFNSLNEKEKALESYNLALSFARAVENRRREADLLVKVGRALSDVNQYQDALRAYDQAVLLMRALQNKSGEADALIGFGVVHFALGNLQKAFEFSNEARELKHDVGDKDGEADAIHNIGFIYYALGEKQKALDAYNQALPLLRSVNNHYGEATTLVNIGNIFLGGEFYSDSPENTQQALEIYKQALPLLRTSGNRGMEAGAMNNMGIAYLHLGQPQKALELQNQALDIFQTIGDEKGEAEVRTALSNVYLSLGDKQKSLELNYQALPLMFEANSTKGQAGAFNNLMSAWSGLGKPRLAIFYGKQALDRYQQIRDNMRGLEQRAQHGFLNEIEFSFKNLASLLITESRLEEATRVLNLLRDQEFFDFDPDANRSAGQTALTVRETVALSHLETVLKKVVKAKQPLTALRRTFANRQPSAEEMSELKRLEGASNEATNELMATLKTVEAAFDRPPSGEDRVEGLVDVTNLKAALGQLSVSTKQRPAALYTLITDNNLHIIIIQPDGELKAFRSSIKAAELNQKILQFYAILQLPAYDPRPLGKQLYEIILKPVDSELKKSNVQVLMWQLDGILRYIPLAAIFDGEEYLNERFQNVVFTRAEKGRLTGTVNPNWTGMGFGSSQAHTVDLLGDGNKMSFNSLPGVTAELRSIFGARRSNEKIRGILEGEVFTDAEFNKSSFYGALKQGRPLIHISSHFSFHPGDDSRSFLLLGDGTALTLNELKKQKRLFVGTELLTLSACNTAAQRKNADGREIDGFAELAQRLGAGAVLATLWSVSDNSTPYLMTQFYRLRQRRSGATKATALRQAQLSLLRGTAQVESLFNEPPLVKGTLESNLKIVFESTVRDNNKNRDTGEIIYINQKDAPPYQKDAAKPYAHPYYWAPFVLFGNWR